MVVYVEDAEPVSVEDLTLDEARAVLARDEADLPMAFNSAHAACLLREIRELEAQIEWLEAEQRDEAAQDAAAEHAYDLWADHDLGIPA